MPLGACQGITIPTKQKRRSTGQGAKKPLDPQQPEKISVPAGASGHELSRPKRVSWLPAYGMMSAMSIPVSCVGVKTHVCMDDLVVRSFTAAPIAARRQDLQVEHPVRCRDAAAFHFHPTPTRILGSPLVRNQVVEMRQPREKRRLAPAWVMKAFHVEELAVHRVMRLIQ